MLSRSRSVNAAFTGLWDNTAMISSAVTTLAVRRPDDPGPDDALRKALLDSRQRWRSLVSLASDFAFETDAAGLFTFVWPEDVLGWPHASLVGQPAVSVLATPDDGFNPFVQGGPACRGSAWVLIRDGGCALLRFSVTSLPGDGGLRGVAADMTADNAAATSAAASLRRAEVMDHVVACMREELVAPRMLGAVLQAAVGATGAQGAAVAMYGAELVVRHQTSDVPDAVLALARQVADRDRSLGAGAAVEVTVMTCAVSDRFGANGILLFWRLGGDRRWSPDDRALAVSLTGVVRVVLEQDQLLHETSRQSRTDPLTGLLNHRAFGDELARRMGRVEALDGRGVLVRLDVDGFKAVNEEHGREAGDAVLVAVAGLLRHTFRPTDLLARLSGDEFAVWLDAADELTAAERAEDLRGAVPEIAAACLPEGAYAVTASVGIAPADETEGGEELMRRAGRALSMAKGTGRGAWYVAHRGAPT